MNQLDTFACFAMAGTLANKPTDYTIEEIVQDAYNIAEAMLVEKQKRDNKFSEYFLRYAKEEEEKELQPAAETIEKIGKNIGKKQEKVKPTLTIREWGDRHGLHKRYLTALEKAGVKTLDQLSKKTLSQLQELPGAGRGFIRSVQTATRKQGINLIQNEEDKIVYAWARNKRSRIS